MGETGVFKGGVRAGAVGLLVGGLACLLVAGVAPALAQARRKASQASVERAVRAVLDVQVAAWNRGDIDAFMEGYARSETTRFASGGNVVRGWQTVRDRYKQNYDTREKMGRLSFSELEVTVLSPDAALVFGRFRLERSGDEPTGLFTLQFARTPAGWRIVADHTSSAEAAPAPPPSPEGEIGRLR
jgi:ketosteroid isomerase-like protein